MQNKHPARLALASLLTALALPATHAAPPPQQESIVDLLEQEKRVDNIYKAWFPSKDIARKAAISFHEQLLEIDYAAGYMILELDAAAMDKLRPFGFRFERASEYIQRRNAALTAAQIRQAGQSISTGPAQAIPGYACYETVEETFAVGDALIAARPGLASWADAGDSWLKTQAAGGYDIRVLKLTNTAIGGDKPKLFVNSAIHAREYATAPVTLEFARWLVNGWGTDADATWILNHHEVHLMLHTNPDGRKRAETGLSWRKNVNNAHCANTNTRGVDLNRNFTATWNTTGGQGSSGSACNLTYRGPSAGSEPETRAVEAYIRSLWPDRRGPGLNDPAPPDTSGVHIDVHSFAQLVLWPWGETAAPAPNGTQMQTMGRRLAFYNGYTPQQSIGLYPTDGTSDSPSYFELGVASFTIEIGTAFFESCTSYNNATKPNNLQALIYAAKVVRTPYITPGGPDVTGLALGNGAAGAGIVAGTPVPLTATATDTRFNNSNGAEPVQAIAAAEVTIDVPPWDPAAVPLTLSAVDGSYDATSEGIAGTIPTTGLAPGQHIAYVRARDAGGTWGPVTAAFINVAAAVAVRDLEPNNTPDTAQVLPTLPALLSGTMDSSVRTQRSDTDFYSVTVPAGRSITATLAPNALLDADVDLLDTAGVRLATNPQGPGQVEVVSWTNTGTASATVLVRVSWRSGGRGPVEGAYTLGLMQ